MIAEIIYFACAALCVVCALLLLRSYRRNHTRLLLWSGLCFIGLSLNNALLFVDLILLPQVDLSVIRLVPAFAGLAVLCYGLIWDAP